MKRIAILLTLAASLLACMAMLSGTGIVSGQSAIPKFPSPILVTCTGQTPGSLTLQGFMDAVGISSTHDAMVLPSKMGGYKTMVVVMGASLKGLGAAGIDQDEELERCKMVFKKAKGSGMKIVAAHIEGVARRNAIADKFIIPFVPEADFLLVMEEGNADGLFTKLSKQHNIPMVTFKDFSELPNILVSMFK